MEAEVLPSMGKNHLVCFLSPSCVGSIQVFRHPDSLQMILLVHRVHYLQGYHLGVLPTILLCYQALRYLQSCRRSDEFHWEVAQGHMYRGSDLSGSGLGSHYWVLLGFLDSR